MIDIDSLCAYVDETINTLHIWQKRDKGRKTAIARLKQMSLRLLQAQNLKNKKYKKAIFMEAWVNYMEPILLQIGTKSLTEQVIFSSLDNFIKTLEQYNCFNDNSF